MASAEIMVTERVVKIERVVTLTLNNNEALTLAAILSRVGGSSLTSYRGDADSISNALEAVGITWGESQQHKASSGHILFEDTLEE